MITIELTLEQYKMLRDGVLMTREELAELLERTKRDALAKRRGPRPPATEPETGETTQVVYQVQVWQRGVVAAADKSNVEDFSEEVAESIESLLDEMCPRASFKADYKPVTVV